MSYTFRTSTPLSYISPSAEEMKAAAAAVQLKTYSRDLVADLCNIAAGGTICPPSSYRKTVREHCEQSVTPSGNSYKCNSSTSSTREGAIDDATSKMMKYHQNVCDFLLNLQIDRFPGDTPLQKAMSCLKVLSMQSGGGGGGEGGEPLPIFMDKAEEVAKAMHDVMETVENLSKEEVQMLDPKDEISEGGQLKSDLSKLKVAEDLSKDKQRIMLEVSRKLDEFTKLQVRKREFVTPDPEGEETQQRPMQNLSELAKIGSAQWAMYSKAKSLFMYKAVTGQVPVSERVTRQEKKQAIFILVDGSGSMHGTRHHKATGVVMNRLKAALKGDAVVFVSVFDTNMSKPNAARTPEEAKQLIKKFAEGNFSGGGTDIAAAVKAAHKYMTELIEKGELLYKPEIVVLTDDDSSASGVTAAQINNTTVHGFAMNNANPELKKLALSTGGLMFENF